jgi:tight adherence protein B
VTAVVVAIIGAAGGIGVLLVWAGLRGVVVLDTAALADGRLGRYLDRLVLRSALAIGAALLGLWFSRWIVVGVVAAGLGWWAPTWRSSRGDHQREVGLVEAIASWTEQIRDTLAAANGLEHAIGATASLAPAPIAAAVERLAARTDYERLPDALRRFADEVDHASADFVVAALVIAAEQQARDLGALLGNLADSARDEARMRTRVWVGRARTRSAVRIITVVIVSFVLALIVFNREYLRPYDTAGGQLVLCVIVMSFIGSFVAMQRLARIATPARFTAARR